MNPEHRHVVTTKNKTIRQLERFFPQLRQENIQEFFDHQDNIEAAKNASAPEVVVCMDEGTALSPALVEPVLALAGSGCLCEARNQADRIEKLAQAYFNYAKEKKLSRLVLTTHDGCGAGKLAHQSDFPDQPASFKETDAEVVSLVGLVAARVKNLAQAQGRTLDISNRHLSAPEMARPAEFHKAVAAVYDLRPGKYFNPNLLPDAPPAFLVHQVKDAAGRDLTDPIAQLKLACRIAFSDHGLDRFFPDKPFTIIVVSDSPEEFTAKKEAILEALKKEPTLKLKAAYKIINIVHYQA